MPLIFRGFLRGDRVRRDIHDGRVDEGREEIFEGIGNAENRRGRAPADFFPEKGVFPSYFVNRKEFFFHCFPSIIRLSFKKINLSEKKLSPVPPFSQSDAATRRNPAREA